MISYASLVPLIGGQVLGMQDALGGQLPEYLLSYTPFKANDSQLLNYYGSSVPYHLIDEGNLPSLKKVDVISSTCPCAGLSSLNPQASASRPSNDWMLESAKYALGTLKPSVYWGENAPRLATAMGLPVVNQLRQIAAENGYTFSLYKTKSFRHGLGQVRDRSFYFFWRGNRTPILETIDRRDSLEPVETTILNVKATDDPINQRTPTEDPFYRYVLEVMNKNKYDHASFVKTLSKSDGAYTYIRSRDGDFAPLAKWFYENDYEKLGNKMTLAVEKMKNGKGIMEKGVTWPVGIIGAFVGHMPHFLTHPIEDRYITIKESLAIMKMPPDFELVGGRKNANMICQNVPVTTASDMMKQIIKHLNNELDTIAENFHVVDNKSNSVKNSLDSFFNLQSSHNHIQL